jgi:ElaB/YqjD/DUF883 family membrane-anchored ribosome-binding protein
MAVRTFPQDGKINSPECEVNTSCPPNDVKGKAQDLASAVVKEVRDVASDVGHKAKETAAAAVHKTDDGIAAVGHQMNALGEKLREAAPHNGAIGSAATAVADELQAEGHYLEGHGLAAIGKDLTDVVRRHPIPSLLIGFGIGCLLGMAIAPRRS